MSRIKILYISILAIFGSLIIGYNYYVANSLKYDFGGDASDFIHLGLTLAKTGKYGHIKISHDEIIEGLKTHQIGGKEYSFAGHSTWRPPVWPSLIAISFLFSGYSLGFLLIVKFLLHFLGAFLFYKCLKYLEIRFYLLWLGVFLYAVSPAWQLYSRVFLSEPVTLFFMTLFAWSLIRYLKTGKHFCINGIVAGILILSHPYYLFLPFSIWLFLFLNKKLRLPKLLILSMLAILVVSSWVIRNYIVLNAEKAVITTSSGAVMAKGWNSAVPELHTNTKGDLADEALVLKNYEYDKSDYSGEVGMMRLYQDATVNFITSNPKLILPIIWKKLVSAFNPFPETPRPGVVETGRVIYQVLALLAMIIIIILGSGEMRALVLGLLVSTVLITIITYSGFRFRMPQTALEILFVIYIVNFLRWKFSQEKIRS